MEKNLLKIIVCFHKEAPLFELYKNNPNVFVPVFGGKKLYNGNSDFILNMIGDNTGKNISEYNKYLSEFSQLYWTYYNYDKLENPEYIGLFHYRRFLLNCFELKKDIIYVYKDFFGMSIATQFLTNHSEEMLYCAKIFLDEYLKNKSNEIKKMITEAFDRKTMYCCNIFVMHKDLFFEYGKYICDCIDLVIKILNTNNFINNEIMIKCPRAFGYILERMTDFFIYKIEKEKNIIIKSGVPNFINDNQTVTQKPFYE